MTLKGFLRDYGLLVLALVALVGVSALGVMGFQQMRQQGNALYQDAFIQVDELAELHLALQAGQSVLEAAPAELDGDRMQVLKERFTEQSDIVGKYFGETHADAKLEAELLSDIHTSYVAAANEVFEYAAAFAQDQATQTLKDKVRPAYVKIKQYILDKTAVAKELAEESLQNMQQTEAQLTTFVGLLAIGLVVVVAGVGGYLGYQQALQKKATKAIVLEVTSMLEGVAASSVQMNSQSSAMVTATDFAKQRTQSVSAAVAQTSASMASVSAAVEELASTTDEIRGQSDESNKIANEAISEVRKTNQAVSGMSSSIEQIANFVSIITDIAEQTNLLALNAAIEAARAGDAGRGFAVVADEVRKLSTQTNKAADDIVQQIQNMQSVSGEVQEAIELTASTMDRLTSLSEHVTRSVTEQNAATQDIARSISEVTGAMDQVGQDVVQVDEMNEKIGEESRTVQGQAAGLESSSAELNKKVGDFVVRLG